MIYMDKIKSGMFDDIDEQDVVGMSEQKLKPCPFCGGKARLMDMGYPHWVYCEDCGAKVHGGTHDEKDSIEAWNRKTNEIPAVSHWEYKHRHHRSVRRYTGFDDYGEKHTISVVEEYEGLEPFCARCGALAPLSWKNYCPKCGAKMEDKNE